jgi:hypothetical protein
MATPVQDTKNNEKQSQLNIGKKAIPSYNLS